MKSFAMDFLILGVMVILFVQIVNCYKMAKIFNTRGRSYTSSTVAWDNIKSTKELPDHVIPILEGGPLWCRIQQPGIWVTGIIIGETCRAPFLQSMVESDDLEIMFSFNGFARLVPVAWDSLQAIPDNSVTSGERMLLAYYEDKEEGGLLPGYVDPVDRRGYFLKEDSVVEMKSGTIITEIEPTKYILENVEFLNEPRVTYEEKILDQLKLENPTKLPTEVIKNINYTDIHRTYWGRVKGTVSGLETIVPSPLGGNMKILWNKSNNKDEERAFALVKLIPAGQYVNVQLKASVRSLEATYKARLTAVFDDGTTITKNISDPHSEQRIAEVVGEFSQFFYLGNDWPVPNTNESSEVLLHSSTTTTTTASPYLDGMERSLANSPESNQISSSAFNLMPGLFLWCLISMFLK